MRGGKGQGGKAKLVDYTVVIATENKQSKIGGLDQRA
jgi:hypothetical protein